jgi:hypothetical protein
MILEEATIIEYLSDLYSARQYTVLAVFTNPTPVANVLTYLKNPDRYRSILVKAKYQTNRDLPVVTAAQAEFYLLSNVTVNSLQVPASSGTYLYSALLSYNKVVI